MATVFDLTDLGQLTTFAREEVPKPATFTLDQYLPDDVIDDVQVDVGTLTKTNRSAVYKAYDAATPLGKRDTFATSKVRIPVLGQKLPIGEYEIIELARARGSNVGTLANDIYNDVDTETRAIQVRAEWSRSDVLTDGKFTLTGENGLTLEYDAGVPAGNLSATPGVDWATIATADPIADIEAWVATYSTNSSDGSEPGLILTSRKVVGFLLRNTKIATLAASLNGTPGVITPGQLDAVLSAHGLPPIRVYRGKAKHPVTEADTNILADDKVFMLPSNPRDLGRTVWGITAEALELVNSGYLTLQSAPGITAVTMKEYDPPGVVSKCVATMMPVLDDPTKLFVVDVTAS